MIDYYKLNQNPLPSITEKLQVPKEALEKNDGENLLNSAPKLRAYSIRDSGREVTLENLKAAARMVYGDDRVPESKDVSNELFDILKPLEEPTPENMLAVIDRKYGVDAVIRFQKWCPQRKASFRFDARIFSPWVFFDFGSDNVQPGCVVAIVADDAAKYVEVFGPTTQLEMIPFPHRFLPWCVVPVIDICGNQHEVQIE